MSGAAFFGYALWLLYTCDSEKGSRKKFENNLITLRIGKTILKYSGSSCWHQILSRNISQVTWSGDHFQSVMDQDL